ncbi:MAG: hypothetical protein RJB38_2142 [Pseudomonadota bacterium]|jgi:hypothetical protein
MAHWRVFLYISMLLSILGAGCGTEAPKLPTGCTAHAAALGITDGRVAIFCGCAETAGTWLLNSAGLQCTVASGDTVVFHFLAPKTRHQIVSAAGEVDRFLASPVYDPQVEPVFRAHAVRFTQAGTYDFTDQFDHSLSARIVVTP